MRTKICNNSVTLTLCNGDEFQDILRGRDAFTLVHIIEGSGMAGFSDELSSFGAGYVFIGYEKRSLPIFPVANTKIFVIQISKDRGYGTPGDAVGQVSMCIDTIFENSHPCLFDVNNQIQNHIERLYLGILLDGLMTDVTLDQARPFSIIESDILGLLLILSKEREKARPMREPKRFDAETEKLLKDIKLRILIHGDFTIRDIAEGLQISPYNLNRAVIKGTGSTLKSFVNFYVKNKLAKENSAIVGV